MGACNSKQNKSRKHQNLPINRNYRNKLIVKWTVNDVYNWLLSICDGELSHMAQTFKKHNINGEMLINLTDQQLNSMNISIDHQSRFKLLLRVQLSLENVVDDDDQKGEGHKGVKATNNSSSSGLIITTNNQRIKPNIMHKINNKPIINSIDHNQNNIQQTTICYDDIISEMEQIASDTAQSVFSNNVNPNNGISTLNGGNNGNRNSHQSSNRNNGNNSNSSRRSSNTQNNQNSGGNGGNFGGIGGIGGGGGNGDDDGDDDDKKRKKFSNWNDLNEEEEDDIDDDDDDEKERERSVSVSSLNHNAPSYLPPIDEGDANRYNVDIVSMKSEDNKNDEIQRLWSEISDAVQQKQMVLIQNKMNEIQIRLKSMNKMNGGSHKKDVNIKRTNNKKKKRQKKKGDLGRFSYEAIDSKRGIGNWQIPKKLTRDKMPKIVMEKISDYFGYIDGCIAMQQYDDKKYEEIDRCIINLDIHHKEYKEENLYLVSKIIRNTNKERNYKWRDTDILTGNEVKNKYNIYELPKSSRDEYKLQITNMDKIKVLISETVEFEKQIIIKTKWHKLDIFNIKNNKCRIMINITNPEFESKLKEFMNNNNNRNYTLIPIIMFNNIKDKYGIHYVHIISIMDNSVGISYEYDKKRNRIQATGIHLDKNKLFKMHELASPHHMDECQCFNSFKSKITHLAVGNPDAQKNLIKTLNKTIQDQKFEIAELKKMNNNNNNKIASISTVTTPSDNNQCAVSRSVSFTSTPSIPNEYSYSSNSKTNNILQNASNLFPFSPNYAQNIQNSLSVPNLTDYNNNNNNNNYYGNLYQQNMQNQSFNKYEYKQF